MAVSCCENIEIGKRDVLSEQEFKDIYFMPGVPVVIRGAVEDWPARNWTLDSLCNKVGDNKVNVRFNTDSDDYKLGRKYQVKETTFRQYVENLKKGNKTSQKSYMAVQNLRKSLPQIQDDVIVPPYVGKLHGGPYLWIAHPGHYEYCHIDPDDGLLVMLQGTKRVRLFGCDLDPLYPNPLGSKGRTIQAQVDCNAPDLEEHPLFYGITCYHCELHAGEMLYIPAFWWHQITSVDICISVNMFWGNGSKNDFLTKAMEPPLWPAFSHWLLNVIEQNRPYESFSRTLSRLPEALFNFLKNQWHEEATDEQLEILVRHIKMYLGIAELPDEKTTGKFPPPLQIRGLVWR